MYLNLFENIEISFWLVILSFGFSIRLDSIFLQFSFVTELLPSFSSFENSRLSFVTSFKSKKIFINKLVVPSFFGLLGLWLLRFLDTFFACISFRIFFDFRLKFCTSISDFFVSFFRFALRFRLQRFCTFAVIFRLDIVFFTFKGKSLLLNHFCGR